MVKIAKLYSIDSTYSGIVETWERVSEKLNSLSTVSDCVLLRSESGETGCGYMSISKWDSISSFRKAVSEDQILKFHFRENAATNGSFQNLYKCINEYQQSGDVEASVRIYTRLLPEGINKGDAGIRWLKSIREIKNGNCPFSSSLYESMSGTDKKIFMYTVMVHGNGELSENEMYCYVMDHS